MTLFPLFGDDDDRPPLALSLGRSLRVLAEQGIYFGTSSWKYEGWLGSIYSPDRYRARGKLSTRKFEDECLREYAETFPIVGGDFSFYQFPTPTYWERLFASTASGLRFCLKVPEEITVATWPGHARYGKRAGLANEAFLDARLCETAFLRPLEPYRDRVAVIMFEFGTFPKKTMPSPDAFLERLDPFLASLPEGFRYAVEIRNPEYLGQEYFATLAARQTAHLFNAWTRMPELGTQIQLPGAVTTDFVVARALLAHGRGYEQAVQRFEPYRAVQEPNPAAREALRMLADGSRQQKRPAFLLVNNRLEGNAPGTIAAVAAALGA